MEKQQTSKYPEGVRFSYLRDGTNTDRVLTIARVYDRESNTVKFGWAINYPSHWRVTTTRNPKTEDGANVSERIVQERIRGDSFSRKEGRTRALERMANEPLVAVLEKGQIPLEAALRYLVNEAERRELPYHVVEIAGEHAQFLPSYDSLKIEEPIKHKTSWLDRMMKMFRK